MLNEQKVILLVEDEEKLRKTVKEFLLMNQYYVLEAEDGEQALEIFCSNNQIVDMVLLDVMLPYCDGYTVLDEIRNISKVPVIMITAKNSESDQIKGFNVGTDDYITKPFLLSVLKVRMEAIFRRTDKYEDFVEIEDLVLYRNSQKVYLKEEELLLTPREYQLLLYLIENESIVLSREQILSSVWGMEYIGGERTVDTVIKQLRTKLGEYSSCIQSIYGIGYRFEVKNNEND